MRDICLTFPDTFPNHYLICELSCRSLLVKVHVVKESFFSLCKFVHWRNKTVTHDKQQLISIVQYFVYMSIVYPHTFYFILYHLPCAVVKILCYCNTSLFPNFTMIFLYLNQNIIKYINMFINVITLQLSLCMIRVLIVFFLCAKTSVCNPTCLTDHFWF